MGRGNNRWWFVAGVTLVLPVLTALLAVPSPAARSASASDTSTPAAIPATLVRAIRDGVTERVNELIRGGADVNARDPEGNTPLILAALYAGPDCVELLLKQGADIHAANKAGATALIRAATNHDKVRLLLNAGAKVDVRTELGNTPLILAARRYGNAPTVKLLLDRGASVKERNHVGVSAVLAASAGGDLEALRMLLDRGADSNDFPNAKNPDHEFIAGLRTPLMWAAYRNDLPMIRLLLERGADPNKATAFGTPLSQAAWHDSFEAARLLLDKGARVQERDRIAGFTPLHWACATDTLRPQLVKLLLEKGADPNAAGGDPVDAFLTVPQTPLMLAHKRGNTALVEALKAAGAKAPPPTPSVPPPARVLPDKLDGTLLADAAERAVAALQATAAKSLEMYMRHASKQDCVSCHQQYLPMAAVGHARERSLRLDTKAAQEQIDVVHRLVHKAGDVFFLAEYGLQALFHPEPASSAGYEAFGLIAEKVPPGLLTDVRVHLLATIQAADGRWEVNLPRPPIQSGDVSATALAIQALMHYGWPGRKAEFATSIDRGRKWLWSVKAETNDEVIFQLLGLHWAGEQADKLAGLAKALVDRQREDGGWSQLPTLGSDAYATGQALYALARAAKVPITDRTWQRGLRFLLATQHDDSSWYVAARAFPFQPTMSSGFPHGRNSWLSAAATSWAVMALTQAIEPRASVASRPPRQKPSPGSAEGRASEPTVRVDFGRDVKPLLERSCLACHGPERPRSHYRVDSRTALLKGGDSGEAVLIPGHSNRSPLVEYVSGPGPILEMPPPAKRDRFPALTREELRLLRAWVDQGAVWPNGVSLSPPAADQRR